MSVPPTLSFMVGPPVPLLQHPDYTPRMATPPLRGMIFDMDGVLTDSEPFIIEAASRMFAERYHVAVKHDDFLPFTGAGEDRFIGGVAAKYGVKLTMPDDKLRTYAIYLDIIRGRLHPLAGAVEFIEQCRRRKLKCALATSADRMKMEGNLKEIGIPPESFEAIVTGSEVERKKPDPQVFEVAAQKLGLDNAHCIVVEDAVNGVKAGKAAGSRVLGITTTFDAAALRAVGADWTAPDLAHVPAEVLG